MNWNRVNNELSEAILRSNRLHELLEELGCELGNYPGIHAYRGPCPVHKGRNKNFVVKADGHTLPVRWKCYSHHCEEKYKPSLLGLVYGVLSEEETNDFTLGDAVKLMRKFAGDVRASSGRRPKTVVIPPKKLALTREQVRQRLKIPSPFFVARGFSPAVLDALDVGHSPRLLKTVVPVYDDDGKVCVGIEPRTEAPHCEECDKYHSPGMACNYGQSKWAVMKGFPKGEYLYNYASARASTSPFVVLLEGPGDVFRALDAGLPAVAAFGTDLSLSQANKLATLGKKVIIAFDNDHAGDSGADRADELLRACGVQTKILFPPDSFHDVGEMAVADIVAWLNQTNSCDILPAQDACESQPSVQEAFDLSGPWDEYLESNSHDTPQ